MHRKLGIVAVSFAVLMMSTSVPPSYALDLGPVHVGTDNGVDAGVDLGNDGDREVDVGIGRGGDDSDVQADIDLVGDNQSDVDADINLGGDDGVGAHVGIGNDDLPVDVGLDINVGDLGPGGTPGNPANPGNPGMPGNPNGPGQPGRPGAHGGGGGSGLGVNYVIGRTMGIPGASGACGKDEQQAIKILQSTDYRKAAISHWMKNSRVNLVRVKLCAEVRAKLLQTLQANSSKVGPMQKAAQSHPAINAALANSGLSAGKRVRGAGSWRYSARLRILSHQ